MIWKKFNIELYRTTIYVCVAEDGEEVIKKILRAGYRVTESTRKQIVGDKIDGITCKLFGKEASVLLIWIRSAEDTPHDISIIAHECFHASNFIVKFIGQRKGVPPDFDEFQAYILEDIVEKVLTIAWSS